MNRVWQKRPEKKSQSQDTQFVVIYGKYGLPNESLSEFKTRVLEWQMIANSCPDICLESILALELKNNIQNKPDLPDITYFDVDTYKST